jgi:hypothetical protein
MFMVPRALTSKSSSGIEAAFCLSGCFSKGPGMGSLSRHPHNCGPLLRGEARARLWYESSVSCAFRVPDHWHFARDRESPQCFKAFYARRALRIFPLYYSTLLLYFHGVVPLMHNTGHSPEVNSESEIWFWMYLVN